MARATRVSGVRDVTKILVVEDDPHVAQAIGRLVPHGRPAIAVRSIAMASEVLASGAPLAAAVIDVRLPDGSGLDVLRLLRKSHPYLPAVVVTALLSRELVNEVTALRAQYICKPDFGDPLLAFFGALDQADEQEDMLQRACAALHLNPRETEILRQSFQGVPRGRLAEVLGISENTLKKQIRSLLTKTSQSSLSEAMWLVKTREG
jgi:DNA-binding NarL/FixJ family response regulator